MGQSHQELVSAYTPIVMQLTELYMFRRSRSEHNRILAQIQLFLVDEVFALRAISRDQESEQFLGPHPQRISWQHPGGCDITHEVSGHEHPICARVSDSPEHRRHRELDRR
jgi:hypothetical protein